MNEELNEFITEVQNEFKDELIMDENKDYRRGYYAGALYAALMIKDLLKRSGDVK